MPKIQLLDQGTINKIAAGEVVERPASIVKELVENAIDASASALTIEIADGGLSMIRITDNGIGIDKGDIRNAFLRHSTSKIRSADDLMAISSLGFRGEALASIAAVSQIEFITKTFESLTGIRYQIEGGLEKGFEEIGCPEGTTIIVNNLFYNVPARRKFLKTPKTEAGYISELINRLSLGAPHISFKFINNNQIKLHTAGNNNLKDTIFSLYGKEVLKNLLSIDYQSEDIKIQGFIGKPMIARANRNHENYYINGRYIKSKVIQKAIEDAFKPKLTMHRYPFTAFNIIISNDKIDVNVHPNKMDIRFNNEQFVYDQIYQAVTEALNKGELIPEVTFDKQEKGREIKFQKGTVPEPFEEKRRSDIIGAPSSIYNKPNKDILYTENVMNKRLETIEESKLEPNLESELEFNKESHKGFQVEFQEESQRELDLGAVTMASKKSSIVTGDQLNLDDNIFLKKENVKKHRIIGQLFNTYWIVEFSDKYYLIDQHAAHEKVLYEKLIHNVKEGNIHSQKILQPIIINLTLNERVRYEAHKHLFKALGFEIEDYGNDDLIIRGVPYIFNKPIDGNDFTMILDKLQEEYHENKYDILVDDIATMACKAAVKGNEKMSERACHELIDDLLSLEDPYNCPHGRPTIISMTKYELEKKFKRII